MGADDDRRLRGDSNIDRPRSSLGNRTPGEFEPPRVCRRRFGLSYAAKGRCVQHGVIAFLGFCRRHVPDRLQQSPVVEPVYPFKCGELDRFEVLPWSPALDDFGFVEAVDRFSEGIVVAVSTYAPTLIKWAMASK